MSFPSRAKPSLSTVLRPLALRALAGATAGFLVASAAGARAPQVEIDPIPITAPYDEVDNVGGPWVNLATYPVRPMLYDPEGKLWVVNHHDSTVERFSGLTPTPDRILGVPWSPVSIAWWEGDATHDPELLVVCRGTWAVVGLDPVTGAPTRLLQLRPGAGLPGGLDARIGRMAEPGDILVDDVNERAFVSCTGADSVVQIDLATNQIVRVFHEDADATFRLKSPLHLSWDHNHEDVLVAPLHSGNNSLASGGLIVSTLVEDFAGLSAPDQGLPDEDLFRIKPWVSAANPGTVEVVLHEMGTILFGHGLHPATNDFWQLNTEAVNKDPNKQTEPAVKGIFARNRVTIFEKTGAGWGSPVGPKFIGLDPGDQSGAITTANTVGQPVSLAFSPAGYGFVAGLLTDNVLVLKDDGTYVMEWDLPDGAIPRFLLQHPTSNKAMMVYCWGDNKVRGYVVDPSAGTASLRVTYSLHHDPTPPDVAAGREVFFDASHSAGENLSCATCHVDGGNDFLMWNLSNGPLEEKGPMFTQTLVGLQRLPPFHWRGERQLVDFRGAFPGLLGAKPDDGDGVPEPGEEPSDEQFARFQDFVFSLNNPANPNQNRLRRIDPTIEHPDTTFTAPGEDPPVHDTTLDGNPIIGQQAFQDPALVNVGRHSCVDCHDFPLGTDNEINVEQESAARPRRGSMKPAPFHEVWRKHESMVMVSKGGNVQFRSFLGSGFSHLGTFGDLFRFVSVVTDNLTGSLVDDQKANDITDFIHQWDQGLAPAVHFAFLLDPAASPSAIASELTAYLQNEAVKKNCSIAVIGTAWGPLGGLVPRRWAWNAGVYECEDPTFPARSLQDFIDGSANHGESNLFVGLPLGMAERFAIDYDMDGVRNLDPTEVGTEYDDTLPGFDDGQSPAFAAGGQPQVLWETTKAARVAFTTTEPTRAVIAYQEPKTGPLEARSDLLSRHHSVLLSGMRPSTHVIDGTSVPDYASEDVDYTVVITLTDATGNAVAQTPFLLRTDPFIVPDELEQGGSGTEETTEQRNQRSHVVQQICLGGGSCDQLQQVGGDWRASVDLTIAFKRGAWQIPAGSTRFERVRAERRAVIGRVLVERASGIVQTATAAGLTVTPVGGSAVLADAIQFVSAGNQSFLQGVPAPEGQFLAGLLETDANGNVNLTFDVNPVSTLGPTEDLVTGDRLVFNVEAVVEVDPQANPKIDVSGAPAVVVYHTLFRGTFMQWSFPDTKEAQSSVRSASL